jgi:hypothetical protein
MEVHEIITFLFRNRTERFYLDSNKNVLKHETEEKNNSKLLDLVCQPN